MSKKKNVPTPDDTAEAKLPLAKTDDYYQIVATCNTQISLIAANPDLANHPALEAALNDLKAANGDLTTKLSSQETKRSEISKLDLDVETTVLDVKRTHTALGAALSAASHGKIAAIVAWGAEVEDNTKKPLAKTTDAPTNVRGRTFEGAVTLRCDADPRAVGYWYQIGADPMHPETWPTPIFENGVTHTMPDQVVGTTIFYRMAVQRRRTGRGEWSDIMSVLVK